MPYYIDLSEISLEIYKRKLKNQYLPPSRRILKERLEERFAYLQQLGLNNLKELLQELKKPDFIANVSTTEIITEEYLKILSREIRSMRPKPNKLKDFTSISANTIRALEDTGIKDTLKLYSLVITYADRKELADKTGLDLSEIYRLAKLSDLSRIKWVGNKFAEMLYETGIDCVEKAAKADPVMLHKAINKLNKEQAIFKGSIGLNDMIIFIDAAKDLPDEIEF